jgi:hypothetical protein
MSTDRTKVWDSRRRAADKPTYQQERLQKAREAREAAKAPPVSTPTIQPPQNSNPANYQQQLSGMLAPGSQLPAPVQGQFPLPQYSQIPQPGFGNQGGFNPNAGLFGSFAPSQGGMFSGLFGGQQ